MMSLDEITDNIPLTPALTPANASGTSLVN